MEQQFFTWQNWDQHDAMIFGFSDCVLKKALGEFKKGSKVKFVNVDYGKGVMELYKTADDRNPVKFKLTLVAEPM